MTEERLGRDLKPCGRQKPAERRLGENCLQPACGAASERPDTNSEWIVMKPPAANQRALQARPSVALMLTQTRSDVEPQQEIRTLGQPRFDCHDFGLLS
jgi:hypothetical protein